MCIRDRADGFAYVEAALAAGLAVDDFAPRLSFFFNSHSDFFEEIGKFRAARRIWARWLRDRYGARDERSMKLRFHTQTAGVSLTAQQPKINIARVATQALAAVLGGTQSLHLSLIHICGSGRVYRDHTQAQLGSRRPDRAETCLLYTSRCV